jgi:hypothetical protein
MGKEKEKLGDSLEIRPVNCDKWRLPMMATYFLELKYQLTVVYIHMTK